MSVPLQQLSSDYFVSAQITIEDIAELKAEGFDLIINNRPDQEEPNQPSSNDMADAAASLGIAYFYFPVGAAGIATEDLIAFSAAYADKKKALGYCKSGLRSVIFRAMALVHNGTPAAELITEAHEAGIDITGQAPLLASLQKQHGGEPSNER